MHGDIFGKPNLAHPSPNRIPTCTGAWIPYPSFTAAMPGVPYLASMSYFVAGPVFTWNSMPALGSSWGLGFWIWGCWFRELLIFKSSACWVWSQRPPSEEFTQTRRARSTLVSERRVLVVRISSLRSAKFRLLLRLLHILIRKPAYFLKGHVLQHSLKGCKSGPLG